MKTSENKYVPQKINFRRELTHIVRSFRKVAYTYGLQKGILKKEKDQDEVFEDFWMK